MKYLISLSLMMSSFLSLTQVNANVAAYPPCDFPCTGFALIDFEDSADNSPYSIYVYHQDATNPANVQDSVLNITSNDTVIYFNGLCFQGDKIVVLIDANGDSTEFTAVPPYYSLTGSLGDCSCPNNQAFCTASGGIPPYTYSLNYMGGSETVVSSSGFVVFDSLPCPTSNMNLTISDQSGCQVYYTPLIDAGCGAPYDPNCLKEIELTGVNASDTSACDGYIIWNLIGIDTTVAHELIIHSYLTGFSDTLELIPGETSDTIFNLCATYYQLKLDLDSACSDISSITIYDYEEEPTAVLVAESTDSLVSCDNCNGIIEWTYDDDYSNGDYILVLTDSLNNLVQSDTFPWNHTSGVFSGLCPDDYNLTVFDSNGDSIYSNVSVISNSVPISLDTLSFNHPNTGLNDGIIEVQGFGGSPTYSYSIDGGATWQNSGLFAGLDAGMYTVIVSDTLGCESELIFNLSYGDVGFNDLNNNLNIFPNPTDSYFQVSWSQVSVFDVYVFNMDGRLVETILGASDAAEITVPTGLYVIELRSGGDTIRAKVLKN